MTKDILLDFCPSVELKSHQSLKDEAEQFVQPKFWQNSNIRGFFVGRTQWSM